MSDRQRSELELRYLGAMRHLAFRSLTGREDELERREDELERREDKLERREDELERRDAMFLRIRSLLALELLGALSLRAISRHLDCAHSSAGSALHGLERGQLVWRIADTADPDHHVFDLTGRGHAVTDRFRYLLAECGIEESDHWESTRSDDVDAVLRMIQSLGNEIQMTGMVDGKMNSDDRNGR